MINTLFIRQVGIWQWIAQTFKRQFTKRVLRRGNRFRLPTGFMIWLPPDSYSATEVYITKANIDWGAEAIFSKYADRNRDFLDIGAHIGYYSGYLSPLVRRAYAFEPDPRNILALQVNAKSAGNIEIAQVAVSSRVGSGCLHIGSGSSVSSLEGDGNQILEVAVTSIDEFLSERTDIDPALIKTDVEGHDLEALRGAQATTARCQPLIITECEISPDLFSLCAEWRYTIFAFTRDRSSLKMRFQQLSSPEEGQAHWCKMLFLVPQHLLASFREHQY